MSTNLDQAQMVRQLQPQSLFSDKFIRYRDVNQAVDYFFSNHADLVDSASSQVSKVDQKKCVALFETYHRTDGKMDEDGIEKFFDDLGVDCSSDIVAILVSQYCDVKHMGEIS